MKKTVFAVLALMVTSAFAQVHVNGYTRQNGTYVAPHYRTAPNDTVSDNYSTQGNVNPYTGRAGTVPDTGVNYEAQQAQLQRQIAQMQQEQQQQMQQQQRQLQQMQLQQRQQMQQMTPGQLAPACGLFCN